MDGWINVQRKGTEESDFPEKDWGFEKHETGSEEEGKQKGMKIVQTAARRLIVRTRGG